MSRLCILRDHASMSQPTLSPNPICFTKELSSGSSDMRGSLENSSEGQSALGENYIDLIIGKLHGTNNDQKTV